MMLKKWLIIVTGLIAVSVSFAADFNNSKTVKLSPGIRRSDISNQPMTAAMKKQIMLFMKRDMLIDDDTIATAPYVLGISREHLAVANNDRIYVSGKLTPGIENYSIIRPEKIYRDPDTQEPLGLAVNYIAAANLIKLDDPATFLISDIANTVENHDYLIPSQKTQIDLTFIPHYPKIKVSGKIVDVLGQTFEIGRRSAIIVNRGKREGIQPGDNLTIYSRGQIVIDNIQGKGKPVTLPTEKIGNLIIFKVFEKASFGLITQATTEVNIGDLIGNS